MKNNLNITTIIIAIISFTLGIIINKYFYLYKIELTIWFITTFLILPCA